MKFNSTRFVKQAVLVALASTAFASSSFAQNTSAPTAESVQQVLVAQMGDEAKDLTVKVDQGTVMLSGWAKGPREVTKARYLASKVPGVEKAYSTGVRTWTTTDQN